MLLALLLALAQPAPSPAGPCAYDKTAMLAMTPLAFDQTVKTGWRPLADQPGCLPAAADLIAAYRKARWADLRESDAHGLYWHEGQLRAASGQT